jgi:hypothetical protein
MNESDGEASFGFGLLSACVGDGSFFGSPPASPFTALLRRIEEGEEGEEGGGGGEGGEGVNRQLNWPEGWTQPAPLQTPPPPPPAPLRRDPGSAPLWCAGDDSKTPRLVHSARRPVYAQRCRRGAARGSNSCESAFGLQLQLLSERLGLPAVLVHHARRLLEGYQWAVLQQSACGRGVRCSLSPAGVAAEAAAAVFLACREEHCPRSFVEVSRAAGLTRRALNRAITRVLRPRRACGGRSDAPAPPPPARPEAFLPRMCAQVGLGFAVERAARRLILGQGASGPASPVVRAAGALVDAARLSPAHLRQLAQLWGLSAFALNKRQHNEPAASA